MATMTEEVRENRKQFFNKVITENLNDARFYASDEHLKEDGALCGLQMELAHEGFIDWSYVNEKCDYIIRTMQDIKRAGENVRKAQMSLGKL